MRDGKSAKDKDYSLRDWFKGGGWKQTGGKYDGKPCARQPGQTTKPYCRDADDRAAMSKDERNKRAAKKRAEDPNPDRTGKAKIVTQEEIILEKEGKKDACYNKVKSRYSVWPSAYASGALVKCRKVGAANWGNKTEEKDHEYSMARSEISKVVSAAKRLKKKMGKGEGNLQAWVQSKITRAADYIDTAADYMDSGEKNESVDIQTADGRTFVQFIDLIKPEPMKGTQIVDEGYMKIQAGGQTIERRGGSTIQDTTRGIDNRPKPKPTFTPRPTPTYTKPTPTVRSTPTPKPTTTTNTRLQQAQQNARDIGRVTGTSGLMNKTIDTSNKIQSRYDRLRDAMRKTGVGNPNASMNMRGVPIKNSFEPEGEMVDEKCWTGYKQVGMKKKGKKVVPNCVPVSEGKNVHGKIEVPSGDIKKLAKKASKRIDTDVDGDVEANDKSKGEYGEFVPSVDGKGKVFTGPNKPNKNIRVRSESFYNWREELGEDWQAVNKKDKTDGMSPAAVKAYRRENPGSKLKTAVTGDPKPGSKDAKRRKSFCSRSKGQQDMHNIDCSKTPDKAICKARRRWKC